MAWVAVGATFQLCLPGLHQSGTLIGPLLLWLWLLPLAALPLDLLLAALSRDRQPPAMAAARPVMARRKPSPATVPVRSGPALRSGPRRLSRRLRPAQARRRGQPGHQAG